MSLPSMGLQEIYVVVYYKDGTDNSFDAYNTLISGPGSYGANRIMGNINTATFITSSNFNNGSTFKNGSSTSSSTVLPMPASLICMNSSAVMTEARKLLFNSQYSDRGWIGGIGEMIGLSSTASTSDRGAIEGYLAHKWGLAGSLPSNHSHKSISLLQAPKISTDATSSSTAGTYYIRPSDAVSKKYSFIYEDGDLILSSLTAQSITWDQNLSGIGVGQIIDLNASASSNLAVQYTVSDTSVAELAVTNQSSLKGWWKMDEVNGIYASDSAVSDNTGFLRNGPTFSAGKFGNAITLDGTDDHIRVNEYNGIGGSKRRTIALWFKTSTANKPCLLYTSPSPRD